MTSLRLGTLALSAALSATLSAALLMPAAAHARDPAASQASTASALSAAVPVALSVTGPALLASGTAALAVVSVQASATGTVWVLERASDGARWTLHFAADSTAAASRGLGTVVTVTALSAGWLLSAAGEAIAFVPNALGASLLHHEQITR